MPKHLTFVTSLFVLPLLLVSCSSSERTGPPPAADGRGGGRGAGAPVPVVTAPVQQKTMPVTVPAVGTVEAMTSAQIRSQVTGQLMSIHFSEGQDVQKGQELFSLDPRPFQAALQQAEAVLARDRASLQNAQTQQGRSENLFGRGLIPRDQYDTQQAGATALAATVAADQAAVETARLNLQYAEIKAPMSGRTGALGAHVGDLVRANDTTALVVINQLSPVYVTFSVPGRYLDEIRRHQQRKPLGVAAAPGTDTGPAPDAAPARGAVSFIDNAVDATTGTIRLKATFANRGQGLWPGAFVRVTLDLADEPNALVVPAVAVQASQEGQYVYVVRPDRAVEMRSVKVRRQQGEEMVIDSGVAAGETVVTDGHLRLVPGAKVVERGEGGRGPGGAGTSPGDGAGARGGR